MAHLQPQSRSALRAQAHTQGVCPICSQSVNAEAGLHRALSLLERVEDWFIAGFCDTQGPQKALKDLRIFLIGHGRRTTNTVPCANCGGLGVIKAPVKSSRATGRLRRECAFCGAPADYPAAGPCPDHPCVDHKDFGGSLT